MVLTERGSSTRPSEGILLLSHFSSTSSLIRSASLPLWAKAICNDRKKMIKQYL